MRLFSEQMGLVKKRAVAQVDSMDDALRNGLWNVLMSNQFRFVITDSHSYGPQPTYPLEELQVLCTALWTDYFKVTLDTLPQGWAPIYSKLHAYFFNAPWNEVYDFINFVAVAFPESAASYEPSIGNMVSTNARFCEDCNRIMEREQSAYRFVNRRIVRITDPIEINTVEDAAKLPRRLAVVNEHIDRALAHLSNRQNPDYRNSIKESISAVESMCSLITGQTRADLNAALVILEKKRGLHGALKSAFNSIFGYTSDSDGIRHALLAESDLTYDDAKFMLVACAAFVNYLKGTAARLKFELIAD